MRLICGLYRLDGAPASETLLRAMAAQMDVPRLRPSLALWREGPVGMAVLDFSARGRPALPLPATDGSVLAADVRLDEPAMVARKFGSTAPVADDALLQAALDRAGPSVVGEVLGDFAIAHWDKNAQRLTCARDVFGIRPLVYVHKPGELFAFASLPKALHGGGIVRKRIDDEALLRRLWNVPQDDCLVAGIKQVPPAHILEVSRDAMSVTRYWQIDRAAIGTRRCSPADAAREMRRLVDEAVKCRLPQKGEAGAHLSGGLDSSAIAVLAARELRDRGRRLYAYSFLDRQRNDVTLEDESEFVQAILQQEDDIDWTPIRPPGGPPPNRAPIDIDNLTSLRAEAPENQVCARAEAQGVDVILSGWGGDEGATFNGRGAFAELFRRGRWRSLAREISALKRERGWSVADILYRDVASYLVPQSIVGLVRRVAGKTADATLVYQRAMSVDVRRYAAHTAEGLNPAADDRETRWRLMTSPSIALRAEIWAQTGARHGVAYAFPLLDRRVVEFSLSLPSDLFVRDGFRRRPFRDAMTGVLPPRVRLRHNKNIPFPSNMLLLTERTNALLARLDAYERQARVRRLIDVGYLRHLIESLPSEDAVRGQMVESDRPAAAAPIGAVASLLALASYLDQHGDDDAGPAPGDDDTGATVTAAVARP
jgi:asparagine synthase (glutamine-hydrolysing)